MKKLILPVFLIALIGLIFAFWSPIYKAVATVDNPFVERDPDIPAMLQNAKNSFQKKNF